MAYGWNPTPPPPMRAAPLRSLQPPLLCSPVVKTIVFMRCLPPELLGPLPVNGAGQARDSQGTTSAIGPGSPIVVSAMRICVAYRCTSIAANAIGPGAASTPFGPITPHGASTSIPTLWSAVLVFLALLRGLPATRYLRVGTTRTHRHRWWTIAAPAISARPQWRALSSDSARPGPTGWRGACRRKAARSGTRCNRASSPRRTLHALGERRCVIRRPRPSSPASRCHPPGAS